MSFLSLNSDLLIYNDSALYFSPFVEPSGLISFYPFDLSTNDEINEFNLKTWNDISINYQNGLVNYAYQGLGEQTSFIYNSELSDYLKNKSYSVSFWVKPQEDNLSGPTKKLFCLNDIYHGLPGTHAEDDIYYDESTNILTSRRYIYAGQADGESISIDLSTNWHHIVQTFNKDSSTKMFYLDSSLAFTYTTNLVIDSSLWFVIGCEVAFLTDLRGLNKYLFDQFRFYDREITEEEVISLYNDGYGV